MSMIEEHCLLGCAAIVGDITPNCGVSKQEKQRLEANAIADIQKMLGTETTAGALPKLRALRCTAESQYVICVHSTRPAQDSCVHGGCRPGDQGAFRGV